MLFDNLGEVLDRRAFGELEAEILNILRDGNRQTVKDVQKKLGGKDNYNTVMTVMSRLAQKKVLGRERMGLQYEYWYIAPSNAASFIDKIKHKFMGMKTFVLVSHLIESAEDLSDSEIEEMEEMLKKAKKKKNDH
jgi:predicted transcriptional regulator